MLETFAQFLLHNLKNLKDEGVHFQWNAGAVSKSVGGWAQKQRVLCAGPGTQCNELAAHSGGVLCLRLYEAELAPK